MKDRMQGGALPPDRLVGHRGYPARYPENTLVGLRAALEAGARWVEFDVQLTRDRVPVLFHDRDLLRMTGVAGVVGGRDWDALAPLRAAYPDRFGTRFSDEPIALLAHVVDLLRGYPRAQAFVEIKRVSIVTAGVDAVIDSVLPVLAPVAAQCVWISFDDGVLRAARRRGVARTGWVFEQWTDAARHLAEDLAPEFLFVDGDCVPADAPLWPGPWRWAVYETSDRAVAWRWIARGAELVETDAIGEMMGAETP